MLSELDANGDPFSRRQLWCRRVARERAKGAAHEAQTRHIGHTVIQQHDAMSLGRAPGGAAIGARHLAPAAPADAFVLE